MARRDPAALVENLAAGDRGALARALSLVEQGGQPARDVGRLAWPLGGSSYTLGITGAPGAGKSTLTNRLITSLRADGGTVAVLAIDPSSPFSGGAILGDRIRMQDHVLDTGVFIRSMATRGHLGGLALAAPQALRVLDAAGFPWVVIETVGVGQVEIEVTEAADTTVVVVNPGWGDSIQANKAGLLEIADVFVINKADRPGVQEARSDLRNMIEMSELAMADEHWWQPPIVATVAETGEGIEELVAAIGAHRDHLVATGRLAQRRDKRLVDELRQIVARSLEQRAYEQTTTQHFDDLVARVRARSLDPYAAADEIINA
ncbi:MAG: methylmalonyl Co-A mutase-associated GTPase MeaB [Acidobacteria bacterium]|nr:methylmalonyl Co-A mutase-associated GTPase MeaB [Acidobacteriota bacterium]